MPVGRSLVEDDKLDVAREIEATTQSRGLQFGLPIDHVVTRSLDNPTDVETLDIGDPAIGDRMGVDIGPKTIEHYSAMIRDAKTVVWNGPMGVFEKPAFANGTNAVARAVAGVEGDDDRRRRRLDRGDQPGGRGGSHHAHLHRRRCIAGIPRRTEAAWG